MCRVSVLCVMVVWGALVQAPGAAGQAVRANTVSDGLSSSDWASIREAYEAGRYAAHLVDGGYRAHNPGQQWQVRFDGRGFTTLPDTGAWTWGLELQRYGFVGQARTVAHPKRMSVEGARVAYDWDEVLTEWYVNDARGLEHGYTIHKRLPLGDEEPLTLALAVRGELAPRIQDDGRSVRFVNGDGTTVLTYSGLAVLDAQGHSLPARFERLAESLLLTIDERGAPYPLTIDPIAQQAYLKASNTDSDDQFGWSVAVSGDTVVVGAPGEDSNATGVNGDQGDNSLAGAGAAYVFVRSGASWSQQAYLKASNTDGGAFNGELFGFSVAVSGDTVVVGATGEDSNATGVNGNQGDNSRSRAGAVYVFVWDGTSWSQQAYLKASNTDSLDEFGSSVAVSGDTVLVGAAGEDSNAIGVDGNQANGAGNAGAAYVFVRTGTIWSQQAYLKASNTDTSDEFGISVAVSGDTVVVGADREDSKATGANGNQMDNSFTDAGAAYVFVRSGTNWSQQAYIKASNTSGGFLSGDLFGRSVAVSGDTVVVGAVGEDSSATGVNGNQGDGTLDAGAVYAFVRSGMSWSQQAYIKASNTGGGDWFGSTVAVSGDTIVVGAFSENSNATGVDGNQGSTGPFFDAGAAYVFVRSGMSWGQQAYLKASNTDGDDLFGFSVAVSGDTVVVGARKEDSNATGVNNSGQPDNSARQAGAAYVFNLGFGASAWSNWGCGLAGVSGNPLAVGTGTLVDGSSNSVELSNAAPGALAGLFVALSSAPAPFKGGTLKAFPFLAVAFVTTSVSGTLSVPFVMPTGAPPASELWIQWVVQDAAAVHGFALSNAIKGVTP